MRLEFMFVFYFILLDIFVWCNVYNLGGKHGEGYTIPVLIGTPPQKFNVVVDTGSTNLAIAGAPHPNIDKYFIRANSSTNIDLHEDVLLLYIQGYWSGDLAADVVYFPTMNDVPRVTCDIAFITESKSIYMNGSDWQGILGLAYPALARPSASVRPWIDALQRTYKDKTIAFSLTLCGPRLRGESQHYGNFEVLNNMKQPYPGIQTARVVREWFYEVIITSLFVGRERVPVSCRNLNTDKSIIDSGTTNIRLPKDVFETFVKTLVPLTRKGRLVNKDRVVTEKDKKLNITRRYEIEEWNLPDEFWYKQKTLCWPFMQNWYGMPNISIDLASEPNKYFRINIPGSSYIRQVFDKKDADGKYCYKFSVEPFETGTILGVVALEGFQVIFNRTARTVGFLKSDCGPPVSIEGPFTAVEEMEDDMGFFSQCSHTEVVRISLLNIAAYVVCAVLFLASCMFAYLFGQWLKNKYFKYHVSGTAVSMSHASLINEDS